MFKTWKQKRSQKYLDCYSTTTATMTLAESCTADIETLLLQNTKRRVKVLLVAIERGGNIPNTILNYNLAESFKKELSTNKLSLYSLHCSISTRDKKSVSNQQSMSRLKADIKAILKKSADDNYDDTLIYLVDDLFDTGETLKLLYKAFKREAWYGSATHLFCFSKETWTNTLARINMLLGYSEGTTFPTNMLVIGKVIETKKWLSFWYEG